jgi:hypothetical protein
MRTISMRQTSENPFYGKSALLELYNRGTSSGVTRAEFDRLLGAAWKEAKPSKQMREMFYTILFMVGDITNRQHDLFRGSGKLDQGGNSNRDAFRWALEWMRKNEPAQYLRFVRTDLVRQYTSLDNVIGTRVKTAKGKKTVAEVVNPLDGVDLDVLAEYLAGIIRKANPAEAVLVAKWLTNVRLSKRQKRDRKTGEAVKGGRPLQDATRRVMQARQNLYNRLSQLMGWEVKVHKGNTEFVGLKAWKRQYNGTLESVLFSTGKVKELDKTAFFELLEKAPGGARYRIRRRLLDKDDKSKGKWYSNFGNADLASWFLEWEKFKEAKQAEVRELAEKVRQGTASDTDRAALTQAKKDAKVNTGASTLFDAVEGFLTGTGSASEMNVLVEAIINKVRFEVPALVIADCSGSMNSTGRAQTKSGKAILPYKVAQLLVTLAMLKNPSTELDDIFVRFGSHAEFITDRAIGTARANRFMQGRMTIVNKLIDRTKSFLDNWKNIGNLVDASMGGTSFSSVAEAFKGWLDSATDAAEKAQRVEMIRKYPVFIVVSDGDMNNSGDAASSMRDFMSKMRQWFGWEGVVVVLDVNTSNNAKSKYENIENVIHYHGWNLGIVNTIFTKIHDLEVIDVYTSLNSLSKSNRYEPVRAEVE